MAFSLNRNQSFCAVAKRLFAHSSQCELRNPALMCELRLKKSEAGLNVSSLQVQTVLKKVPVVVANQTEPIIVNKKKLEYKWGMNVLGESRVFSGTSELY